MPRSRRAALYAHVDDIWGDLKRRGLRAADHAEYNGGAALRDLTSELHAHAENVACQQDDDTD
ncbi:hypothetical protein SAMN04487819_109232 [Actinopolyspora alba]|uniref:Uncharacterized protein n=1 Tax=Actinopolyspora alba TaxID=673379 RepID=A0A1I1YUT1_9ACTN|nr:hypothetical protein [Actinopolyspora alba]SFE22748.1 hypothetical protein SAMN04487819_109232 [Actinopolyspora alba]